jgi:hypothetical protein
MKRIKDKSHMIISIAAEKAFDTFQHSFMIKALNKLGIEVTYLNIVRAHIILNGENFSSSKVRNKTRVSTLFTLIQHSA